MRKMKTLFQRVFEGNELIGIEDVVTPDMEWVLNGEGVATQKFDGTCTLIVNAKIFRRYDCKRGKTPPEDFIPCCSPDAITGHWPGWIKMDIKNPKGDVKFWVEALEGRELSSFEDGTYELCGPKINANREKLDKHILIKHGSVILEDCPRTFSELKEYLRDKDIEGIVFHRLNDTNDMCKLKKSDFKFKREVE